MTKKILKQFNSGPNSMTVIYRNIEDDDDDIVKLPKWSVYIWSLMDVILFGLMLSTFVILLAAPRPGIYLESCYHRSCAKGLNLK